MANQSLIRIALLSLSTCTLSACAITEPVEVITDQGEVLQGSATAALSGGRFSVSNGRLTCGGTYDALDTSPTIVIPASCSDGRTGTITAHREPNGTSGSGTISLSDGSRATFAFGQAVAYLAPPVRRSATSDTSATRPSSTSPATIVTEGPGEVPLRIEGGTFVVPAVINDRITLDFHIDSGAADVALPIDVVLTLIRTGTIQSSDFLGSKTYVTADGRSVPSETFRIRSLKVGGRELENVTASVSDVKGSLLLGQSFLSRLSSWSIDNQRKVLILK